MPAPRKRGRVSSAALVAATPLEVQPRPDAPYDLTDEEAQEWWAVVNRMPADWFPRETHSLLAMYCRHVVGARRISELIRSAEAKKKNFDIHEYDRLLKMRERESRAASSLATRMRMTQQTTFDKSRKKQVEITSPPWHEQD